MFNKQIITCDFESRFSTAAANSITLLQKINSSRLVFDGLRGAAVFVDSDGIACGLKGLQDIHQTDIGQVVEGIRGGVTVVIDCKADVFAVDHFKVVLRGLRVVFESGHTVSRVIGLIC
jgi:hypothetical protein